MELEELKSIWKSSTTGFRPKDEKEIASMLTGKSLFIIDKLKRNVWFELVLTVAVGVGLLIYALTLPPGALKWASITIILVFLLYTFFYVKKLLLLNRFNPLSKGIHTNLTTLTETLSGYVVFYKRSISILYPIFFCLFILFTGIERGTEKFIEHILRPTTLLNLTIIAAVYYFVSTKFATWYLNKLYGNHIEKLKGLLNDIHG